MSYVGTQQQTSARSPPSRPTWQNYGFSPSRTGLAADRLGLGRDHQQCRPDPDQAIDLQSQPAFLQQASSGFASANAELEQGQGLPAASVQQYQQYQTQAQAMAQAAGLPKRDSSTRQNIGTLIGGNVSTSRALQPAEQRLLTLAINSTPEQQAMFNQYFGTNYGDSGQGALTARADRRHRGLDPWRGGAAHRPADHVMAQIGGASVTSGVGALQKSTATQLAQAEHHREPGDQRLPATWLPYSALEDPPRPGDGRRGCQQGTVSARSTGPLGNFFRATRPPSASYSRPPSRSPRPRSRAAAGTCLRAAVWSGRGQLPVVGRPRRNPRFRLCCLLMLSPAVASSRWAGFTQTVETLAQGDSAFGSAGWKSEPADT